MLNSDAIDDILQKWEDGVAAGHQPFPAELCRDHPELLPEVEKRIAALQRMAWVGQAAPGPEPVPGYRLLTKLGKGGFGEVWKAARLADGQVVALKLVELTDAGSSELRVIQRLKKIDHPNVLPIYDAWTNGNRLVISMELADGTLLDKLRVGGESPDVIMRLIRQAAFGIDALHAADLMHRDVKPSNILVVNGVAKLGDFGLTKILEHSGVTGHTGILSIEYAAPEHFDKKTTRQGDQYSLAVTYYHLRCGRLPFEGSGAQVMAGHLHQQPNLAPLPSNERAVVARALSKKPDARWPSCKAFVDALTGRVEDDQTIRLPQKQSRKLWIAAVVAVLALAVVLAFWWFPRDEQGNDGASRKTRRGPRPIPAKQEPALVFSFDGKSRIVTPLTRFAPVTLECWVEVRYSSGETGKYIIGSDIPGNSGIGLACFFSDAVNTPVLGAQLLPSPTSRGFVSTARLPLGTLSHVACVYGKKETVIYLNGKPVSRGDATASVGGTEFVIGCAGQDNPGHYMTGRVRSVRISEGERYSEQFQPQARFVTDATAVAIYSANAVEGTRAIDLSGKGNHGTLQGVIIEAEEPAKPEPTKPATNEEVIEIYPKKPRPQNVRSLVVSNMSAPFNRPVAFINGSGGTALIDAFSGDVLRKVSPDFGPSVALFPNGDSIGMSGYDNGTVTFWNLERGNAMAPALSHPGSVTALAFSADGKHCLTGGADGVVRYWSHGNRELLQELKGHERVVWHVGFDGKGTRAVSCSEDSRVIAWKLEDGSRIQTFFESKGRVEAACFADDEHVLSGGEDKKVLLWNIASGKVVREFPVGRHVKCISLMGNSRFITGDHQQIKVWDLASGNLVAESPLQPSCVQCLGWFEKGKEKYVVFGTEEWGVRLWKLKTDNGK